MVISLERDADLHMAQLMQLPLTVCCFSKIQIGFTFLVPAHPEKGLLNVCVCVCVRAQYNFCHNVFDEFVGKTFVIYCMIVWLRQSGFN